MKIQKLDSSLHSGNLLYNRKDRSPHKAGMHLQLGTHMLCLPSCLDKLKCLSKTPSLDPISSCLIKDISPACFSFPAFSGFSSLRSFPSAYKPLYCLPSFLWPHILPWLLPPFLSFLLYRETIWKSFLYWLSLPCLLRSGFLPTAAQELLLSRSPVTHIPPNLSALTFPSWSLLFACSWMLPLLSACTTLLATVSNLFHLPSPHHLDL